VKHILLPLDGTEKSLQSVRLVKELFDPKEVEITLLTVREDYKSPQALYETDKVVKETLPLLETAAKKLEGFTVKEHVGFGPAGETILEYAESNKIDTIIISRATHSGWSIFVGSVAVHIVKYAKCIVIIVPEKEEA